MGGIISKSTTTTKTIKPETSKSEVSRDMDNLKQIWADVKMIGVEQIGMDVFKVLFKKYPDTFHMFKSFSDEIKWEEHRGFRVHSKTFLNVIGNALTSIQTEEELASTMTTIGAAHSYFPIKEEHFVILKDELMNQLRLQLKERFTPEVEKAWCSAYDRVMDAMFHSILHSSTKNHPH